MIARDMADAERARHFHMMVQQKLQKLQEDAPRL